MCYFVEPHALQSQGLLFAFLTRVRLCLKAESCNLRWLMVCKPHEGPRATFQMKFQVNWNFNLLRSDTTVRFRDFVTVERTTTGRGQKRK